MVRSRFRPWCRIRCACDHLVVSEDGEHGRASPVVRAPRFFRYGGDRPAGLELFFDLVFVFCIAQLTRLIRLDPGWATAGEAVALFVPVWWAWVGVTFSTDRFPGDDLVERLLVLTAAAAAGVMGVALTGLPGRGSVWFAAGYAAVRLVLVVIYLRAARAVPTAAPQARSYTAGFFTAALLWLVSVAVPAPARWLLWAVAMVIDTAVPAVTDRRLGLLPVDVHHLPDRFGAFVIIVLGEAVVSTATLSTNRGIPDPRIAAALAGSFMLAAGLWWGFFDRGAWHRRYRRLDGDNGGRLANIICAYLHFPLIAGIALTAAGMQLATSHAGHAIGATAAVTLSAGCAAYLLAMNAMTLILSIPRQESLAQVRVALIVALAILAAAGRSWPAPVYLWACAIPLAVHVAANLSRSRQQPP